MNFFSEDIIKIWAETKDVPSDVLDDILKDEVRYIFRDTLSQHPKGKIDFLLKNGFTVKELINRINE